eukprot:885693-Pyramimonas_sp.AAC.1
MISPSFRRSATSGPTLLAALARSAESAARCLGGVWSTAENALLCVVTCMRALAGAQMASA